MSSTSMWHLGCLYHTRSDGSRITLFLPMSSTVRRHLSWIWWLAWFRATDRESQYASLCQVLLRATLAVCWWLETLGATDPESHYGTRWRLSGLTAAYFAGRWNHYTGPRDQHSIATKLQKNLMTLTHFLCVLLKLTVSLTD